jgi:adenosylcobinamide amidohydrolase
VDLIEPYLGRDGSAPVLVWQFSEPQRVIASASVGGGIGARSWIVNAQVARSYARTDLDAHIADIATANGCRGPGVGLLTAASVERTQKHADRATVAYASVGLDKPTWAADADDAVSPWSPGTINVVAFVPRAMSDEALVNAVITVTEAKTQALVEAGVPGTGTASDAVCVICPIHGNEQRFAGPRSAIGSQLARAVHGAVATGVRRYT